MKHKIATYLFIFLILSSCKANEIKQHKGLTTGQITAKGGNYYRGCAYYLGYSYKVSDTLYLGYYPIPIGCNYFDKYMNKFFPVVYSTINPKKGILLVFPDDFERWGIEFPDSLNWVKEAR